MNTELKELTGLYLSAYPADKEQQERLESLVKAAVSVGQVEGMEMVISEIKAAS